MKQQNNINGSAKTPVQESSETVTPSSETVVSEVCPFIGLESDASTRLMFVSPASCCHRADPVGAINLNHQHSYCLSSVYKLCPVFMKPEWSPLPEDVAYYQAAPSPSKRHWIWVVLGILIVGLMAGGYFIWGNGRSNTVVDPESPNDSSAVVVVSTSTVTATPAHTKTAVLTETISPINTNIPPSTVTAIPSATPTSLPTIEPSSATLVPTFTPVAATKTAVPLMQAVVAVPFLNVRSGPSTAYELLGTIERNEQIELIGRVSDSSWWKICCVNGEPGWVIGEAIEIPEDVAGIVPVVTGIPLPPTATLQP